MMRRTGSSGRSFRRPTAAVRSRSRPVARQVVRSLSRVKTRLGRRARPRRHRPLWADSGLWPYGAIDDYPLDDTVEPGDTRLSVPARQTLNGLGLLDGIWRQRLDRAGADLIEFLNQFHRAAGIGRVVEDYFAGRYQRAVTRMAMRLSRRLAGDDPDARQNLHFDRRISFAPDGQPILVTVIVYRGLHYRLFPWQRLHQKALQHQVRRDRLTYHQPNWVRWVFDRRGMPPARLRAELRRRLAGGGGTDGHRWADALARTALTV